MHRMLYVVTSQIVPARNRDGGKPLLEGTRTGSKSAPVFVPLSLWPINSNCPFFSPVGARLLDGQDVNGDLI